MTIIKISIQILFFLLHPSPQMLYIIKVTFMKQVFHVIKSFLNYLFGKYMDQSLNVSECKAKISHSSVISKFVSMSPVHLLKHMNT